jgi:hypothetical protein
MTEREFATLTKAYGMFFLCMGIVVCALCLYLGTA